MKKMLMMLAAVLCFGAVMADERPVEYATTPRTAQTFIKKHFAQSPVASVMLDQDGEYTVGLTSGTKIEFRKNGAWKKVDCRAQAVPAAIVPAKIARYVKAKYTKALITKIEADHNDYEVHLSTGVELKFDLQGNFVRIDD